jgi:hypothetical protein
MEVRWAIVNIGESLVDHRQYWRKSDLRKSYWRTSGKPNFQYEFDSIRPKLYWIGLESTPLKKIWIQIRFDFVSVSDRLYILLSYITNIFRSEMSTGQLFLSCPVLPSCHCLSWRAAGQDENLTLVLSCRTGQDTRTTGPSCPVLISVWHHFFATPFFIIVSICLDIFKSDEFSAHVSITLWYSSFSIRFSLNCLIERIFLHWYGAKF